MKALTKFGAVGAGAALAVGVMGMSQASSHAGLTDAGGSTHGSHQVEANGGADQAFTKKEAARVRTMGALPKLTGKVNDARALTISSNPVASGRYKIVIRDSTTRHNWHLFGQGISRETGIGATGRFVFRVRLTDGKYTVQCDAHPGTMNFTLTVN